MAFPDWAKDMIKTQGGYDNVEDAACKIALKAKGISISTAARACGIGTGGFTFTHLKETYSFPFSPSVWAGPMDSPGILLTRFEKSKLWRAWVEAWDDRPDVKSHNRMLVVKGGPGWGWVAVYPNRSTVELSDDSSFLCLTVTTNPDNQTRRLIVEPFTLICSHQTLPWGPSSVD